MNKHDNSNYFLNELGSVVIGVLFSFSLVYFFGLEILGIWKKPSSCFFEISIVVILILKCISFIGWYLAIQKYNHTLPFEGILMYGYAITIAASLIMLDYLLYPSYNLATLYTIIVPFGWFLSSKNGTIIAGFWAAVLSSIVFFIKTSHINFTLFLSHSIVALIVISMVSVLLMYFKINKYKLKKSNKLLNQKILETELKAKELEQFVYTVSHDLKEPLRSLSVILDIFSTGNKDILKDDDVELLDLVKKSTLRMGNSIQAMLDYSKLGQNFDLEEVEINKVINDVIFEMDEVVEPIKPIFNINNLGVLNVYLKDFQLLFTHLIDNAIRYRKRDEVCEISISRRDIDHYAVFYITDNGIGIEDINHKRIFKIFQSLEANEKRKGIGLAHCSKIADLHKGNISVESKLGEGSTFILKISRELI